MSWNNITPWWLLEFMEAEKLSTPEFLAWLASDKAKNVPEFVREKWLSLQKKPS